MAKAFARRRRVFTVLVAVLAVLAGMPAAVLWCAYRFDTKPLVPMAQASRLNGLWAGHSWVGSKHTDHELAQFAELLRRNRLSDVFVHVGPLEGDGAIAPSRYSEAGRLIVKLRASCPTLHIQAWIGQVEKAGGGPLDLSQIGTRRRILTTAHDLLDLGFDGIHYDVEPVRTGDSNYVSLLHDTHRLTAERGKITSVAVFKALPWPIANIVAGVSSRPIGLWGDDYLVDVAREVDQVAVMMYDTALPRDYLYTAATAWETRHVRQLLGAAKPVFIGVPTYDDHRLTFHAAAENMHSGLRGVRKVAEGLAPNAFETLGVAIYADWTTDESEWAQYRSLWLAEP